MAGNGISGEEFEAKELEGMNVQDDVTTALFKSNPEAIIQFVSNPCFALLKNDLKEARKSKVYDMLGMEAPLVYRAQGEIRELDVTLQSLEYFEKFAKK